MSVEITMDPICSPPPSPDAPAAAGEVADDAEEAPSVNCKPMYVFISPGVVPVAGDGPEAATVAFAGVLYLHQRHQRLLVVEERVNADPKKKREKWLNEMRGWLIVVAVLVASITYQAGLNPPGGFQQDSDPAMGLFAGDPVFKSISPIRYIAFFYLNATAFLSSLAIIALLMKESFYHSEFKVEALEFIVVFDLVVLAGAYLVGTTRSIQMSLYANGFAMAVLFFFYVVYTMQFPLKLWGLITGARRDRASPVPDHNSISKNLQNLRNLPAKRTGRIVVEAEAHRPPDDVGPVVVRVGTAQP